MSDQTDRTEIRNRTPQDVLRWAWEKYGNGAVFTSSFGAEDMVILDMIAGMDLGIEVATLDTGRLPEETYDLMERASEKYGVTILSYFPDRERVESMVSGKGMNLFYRSVENRKLCCGIRKVEPLGRALKGKGAWITGLRADQTDFRKNAEMIEEDPDRGLVKINPLLEWSSEDVWRYIRENDVPYNALHDQGFPSIGCEPCTRAIKPGEGERAGRWWWETDVKECGLHVKGSSEAYTAPEIRIGDRSSGRSVR